MRQTSNNVSHRQQLPTDQAGEWLMTASLGWRCRCSMVDDKWLINTQDNHNNNNDNSTTNLLLCLNREFWKCKRLVKYDAQWPMAWFSDPPRSSDYTVTSGYQQHGWYHSTCRASHINHISGKIPTNSWNIVFSLFLWHLFTFQEKRIQLIITLFDSQAVNQQSLYS